MQCEDWLEITIEPAPGVKVPDRVHCPEEATHKVRDLHLCVLHARRRQGQLEADKRTNGKLFMRPAVPSRHPWPEPVTDDEVEVGMVLVVRGFGNAEKVTNEVVRTICMHLHRAFDDQGSRLETSRDWELRLEDGRRVVYDHLADDGEHEDHSQVLYIEPVK